MDHYLQFLGLPKGVIDIDDSEEDGMGDYGSEMFAYMREREEEFVVEDDYLDQSSVTPEMRGVLVDWLLQVSLPSSSINCLCLVSSPNPSLLRCSII